MRLDLDLLKEILSDLKYQINLEKQRTPFDPQKVEAYCWIFSGRQIRKLGTCISSTLLSKNTQRNY
jgi:hypothetical protein